MSRKIALQMGFFINPTLNSLENKCKRRKSCKVLDNFKTWFGALFRNIELTISLICHCITSVLKSSVKGWSIKETCITAVTTMHNCVLDLGIFKFTVFSQLQLNGLMEQMLDYIIDRKDLSYTGQSIVEQISKGLL